MESVILPYRRYFDFEGRSARKEYWMFILLWVLVYAVFFTALVVSLETRPGQTAGSNDGPFMVAVIVLLLFIVGSIIPLIGVQVRRFHDQDKSGWFFLLNFIPSVGALVVLVFMCIEGTAGPNRFGDDPRDPSGASLFA